MSAVARDAELIAQIASFCANDGDTLTSLVGATAIVAARHVDPGVMLDAAIAGLGHARSLLARRAGAPSSQPASAGHDVVDQAGDPVVDLTLDLEASRSEEQRLRRELARLSAILSATSARLVAASKELGEARIELARRAAAQGVAR